MEPANLKAKAEAREAAAGFELRAEALRKKAAKALAGANPGRAEKLRVAANLLDAAARCMYEAGYGYGVGKNVIASKSKVMATRHVAEAEEILS